MRAGVILMFIPFKTVLTITVKAPFPVARDIAIWVGAFSSSIK